jgi:hypothetical protein
MIMKCLSRLVFLLVGCGCFLPVAAQVSVSSSLPAKTFLLYEGIPLQMEITNSTGNEMVLTEEDLENQVVFRMRNTDNQVIPRTDRPILKEPWVIADGETSERTFDLVQLFRIRRARSFRGLQHVTVDGEVYEGPALIFDVSKGMLFDEIKRNKDDRVFSLIGLSRGGRDELMLRVTNKDKSLTLATYFLERHLRFYPPHMKLNKAGQVGTLHYLGPQQAVLCIFEPDGTPVKREYYQVSPGVPIRLHPSEDTSFFVEGGTPTGD